MSESKDYKVMGRCIIQEDERKIKDERSVEVDRTKRTGRRPGRRPVKVDQRLKLERSRQSARECRARKKLRYQYLEDLVKNREQAIFALKDELELYKRLCKEVDCGKVTDKLREVLEESRDKYGQSNMMSEMDSTSSPAISSSSASQCSGSIDQIYREDSNCTAAVDRTEQHSLSLPNSLQGSMNELNEIRNEQVPRHNEVAGLLSVSKRTFLKPQESTASHGKILENDDILRDIKLFSTEAKRQNDRTVEQRTSSYPEQKSCHGRESMSEKRLPNLRELLCSSEPVEVKVPLQHMVSNVTGQLHSVVGMQCSYSDSSECNKSKLVKSIDLSNRGKNLSSQFTMASTKSGPYSHGSFQNFPINQPCVNMFVKQPSLAKSVPAANTTQMHSIARISNPAMLMPNKMDGSSPNLNAFPMKDRTISYTPSPVRTSVTSLTQPLPSFFKSDQGNAIQKEGDNNHFSIDFMDMDIEELKSVYIDSCDDVKSDPIHFNTGVNSSKASASGTVHVQARLGDQNSVRTQYQWGKRRSQSDPVTPFSEDQIETSQNWDFLDDMVLKN